MFENLKTGNMSQKLKILTEYSDLLKEDYGKDIKDFIPNCKKGDITYHYICHDTEVIYQKYEFKINNLTYGFENNDFFIYIMVGNIVIFHNREEYTCNGLFNGAKYGWNHKLPKEMLSQIKKDSKTIEGYIKDIKNYMKNNKTTEQLKHCEEQGKLEKIFCKDREEC